MGNARARGTFEQRKVNPLVRTSMATDAPALRILGGNEIRAVQVKDESSQDGATKTVHRRFRQKPGLYQSASGQFYHFDGVSVRRATREQIAAATPTGGRR